MVDLTCNPCLGCTVYCRFLNEHIHRRPDIAHVEIMIRIGMFKDQFLLTSTCRSNRGAPGRWP